MVAQSHLRKVKRARERLAAAQQELADAVVAAHESGETFHDIGEWAGFSRQRVFDIYRAELRRLYEEDRPA